MDKLTNKSGFTLVETVIAIAVFAIAIISLYGLVTLSIKGNATAITVTTAANWAQERVEKVL
jgi:prepilin-type N-terminal cleavage/methylation domain-containing protein